MYGHVATYPARLKNKKKHTKEETGPPLCARRTARDIATGPPVSRGCIFFHARKVTVLSKPPLYPIVNKFMRCWWPHGMASARRVLSSRPSQANYGLIRCIVITTHSKMCPYTTDIKVISHGRSRQRDAIGWRHSSAESIPPMISY